MDQGETQESVSDYERVNELSRSALARWLALLSVALFIMGPIMIAQVIMVARGDGQLPPYNEWGPGTSNHGQWHGVDSNPGAAHLRYGFERALSLPFWAFIVGVVSCMVKPNWIAGAVLILSVVFDLGILIVFIPLFD